MPYVVDAVNCMLAYATMPWWRVDEQLRRSLGNPDRCFTFERRSRRPPPQEPLKVEQDYVEAAA